MADYKGAASPNLTKKFDWLSNTHARVLKLKV